MDEQFSSTILFGTLGNPGSEYSLTRHNVGFIFADLVSLHYSFSNFTYCSKIKGYISSGKVSDRNIIFVKPDTYMNLSGVSVSAAVKAFGIAPDNIFIVHDDLDIEFGHERIRRKGSDAGHKGVRSVIAELGTENFNRIRLGIGKPREGMSVPDFVLSNFIDEELKYINNKWSPLWNRIVSTIADTDVSVTMNIFNRRNT